MHLHRPAWRHAVGPLSIPGQCAICLDWSGQRLCAACCARFAAAVARCSRCALEVPVGVAVCGRCLRRPPPFDAALTAVDYAHPWAALVARFKFSASLDLAGAFATLLCGAVRNAQRAPSAGLLLPVPLARDRLRERGYNQSWEIARRLARRLDAAADPHLLLRVRETPPQLALAPERRAANVRGAFAVEPTRRSELQGRTVTLIDDVMTTGETAGEIARTLKAAGAARVQVWVIARTAPPAREALPLTSQPAVQPGEPPSTISAASTLRIAGSMS